MLNRSAMVVKPRQPFLDWLHTADPTSRNLSPRELVQKPTIYLIPECDTASGESCKHCARKIFVEQLAGWFTDESTWPCELQF